MVHFIYHKLTIINKDTIIIVIFQYDIQTSSCIKQLQTVKSVNENMTKTKKLIAETDLFL